MASNVGPRISLDELYKLDKNEARKAELNALSKRHAQAMIEGNKKEAESIFKAMEALDKEKANKH